MRLRIHLQLCALLLLCGATTALAQGRRIDSFPYQQNFDWVTSATTAFPTTDTNGGEFTLDNAPGNAWTTSISSRGVHNAGGGALRLQTVNAAPNLGIIWYGDFSDYCVDTLYLNWTKVQNSTAGTRTNELRVAWNTSGGTDSTTFTDISTGNIVGGVWPTFDNSATAQSGTLAVALPSNLNGASLANLRIYSANTGGSGNHPRVTIDSLRISARGGAATPPNLYAVGTATDSSMQVLVADTSAAQNFERILLVRSTSAVNTFTPTTTFGNWTAGQSLNSTDTVVYFGGMSEQTDTTFNVTGLQPGTTYYYRAWGFNGCSTTVSSSFDEVSGSTASANAAPQITDQPDSITVCQGDTATFSVAATGTGPLNYQWLKNGRAITGATDSIYTIPSARDSDAATYSVIVSGLISPPDTSDPALLTVEQSTVITGEPTGAVACGSSATLAVGVSGTGPFTYQWYRNDTALVAGDDSVYTIPAVTAADTGSYYVVVTGTCGSDTSASVSVALPAAPAITLQPPSRVGCSGAFTDFIVGATGGGLTYQWRRNGVPIAGADDSVFRIYPLYAELSGVYDVVITDTCGRTITSDPATLTLNEPPLFNETPNSQSTQVGKRVVLSVRVTGTTPIRYQWYKNGLEIPGATSDTYIIPSVTESDLGEYAVMATNPCGASMSPSAFLYVQPAPRIITQPADVTGCEGDTLTLRVGAQGFGLRYQWRMNGVEIPGATRSTLRFAPATPADSGSYDVIISGQGGAPITSDPVDLTVNRLAQITQQPQGTIAACSGDMVTLTVGTSGAINSFQWRRNGVPIPGATGAVYTINPVSTADTGSYDVVVTGLCDDTLTSFVSNIAVEAPAQITLQPMRDSVRVEDSLVLNVDATGSNLTYQWRFNGVAIPGATGPVYIVGNFNTSNAGNYDVIVTGGCGSPDTSSVAVITVDTTTSSVTFTTLGATTRVEIAPNPTTSTTRITITSSRPVGSMGDVHLTVVDGLGREVADLSEAYRASGYTGATLNASALPPGVYLCRLTLGSESRIVGSIVVVR